MARYVKNNTDKTQKLCFQMLTGNGLYECDVLVREHGTYGLVQEASYPDLELKFQLGLFIEVDEKGIPVSKSKPDVAPEIKPLVPPATDPELAQGADAADSAEVAPDPFVETEPQGAVDAPAQGQETEAVEFACPICGAVCASERGLARHKSMMHKDE